MDDAELVRAFRVRKGLQALVGVGWVLVASSMVFVFGTAEDASPTWLLVMGVGPSAVWGPLALAFTWWNFRCPACRTRLPAVDIETGMGAWRAGATCPSCGRRLA